jgi:hypothetical protein
MKRIFAGLALALLLLIACHSQVAPTTGYNIVWTWSAPNSSSTWPGCTTAAPCTYVVSAVALAAGTTTCPATTGTAYAPLNSAAPATALTYTETGAATGQTVCAIVQTEQSGATSVPSASASVAVPAIPLAPGAPVPTTQSAQLEPQIQPSGQLAMNGQSLRLTGRLVRVR